MQTVTSHACRIITLLKLSLSNSGVVDIEKPSEVNQILWKRIRWPGMK